MYAIDKNGNVYSMPRFAGHNWGGKKLTKFKKLKPSIDDKGYYRVNLYKNNKGKTILVHRLIANCYLNLSLNSRLSVNHKDGNPSNNKLINLEVVTHKENIRHAVEILHAFKSGEQHKNSKLTWSIIDKARQQHLDGKTYRELAKMYRVSVGTIFQAINKNTWKIKNYE